MYDTDQAVTFIGSTESALSAGEWWYDTGEEIDSGALLTGKRRPFDPSRCIVWIDNNDDITHTYRIGQPDRYAIVELTAGHQAHFGPFESILFVRENGAGDIGLDDFGDHRERIAAVGVFQVEANNDSSSRATVYMIGDPIRPMSAGVARPTLLIND